MNFQFCEAQVSGAQLSGAQLSGGSTVGRLNCRELICRGSTVGAHLSGAQLSVHRSCQCSTNQQSNNNPSSHHFIINPLFTQTLTTLNLSSNEIGDQGAQDLANALQINKVTTILLLITSSLTHFSLRHSPH
jgi:hypothetical protein